MAKIRRVIRKQETSVLARFDEQLWPVNLALVLLGGLLMGIVLAKLRFDDPRWWCSAWFHLLVVSGLVGAGIYGATLLQGKFLRRGMQLSLVISLALHAVLLLTLMSIFMPEIKLFEILTTGFSNRTPLIVSEQPVRKLQQPLLSREFDKPVERQPEEAATEKVERQETTPEKTPEPEKQPEAEPQQNVPVPTPAPQRKTEPAETAPRRSDTKSELSRQTTQSLPEMSARPATAAQAATTAPQQPKIEAQSSQVDRQATASAGAPRASEQAPATPREVTAAQMARRTEQTLPVAQSTAQPTLTRQVAQPQLTPRTQVQAAAQPTVSQQTQPDAPHPANLTAQRAATASPQVERRPSEPTPEVPTTVAQAVERRQQPSEANPNQASTPTNTPNRRTPTEAAPTATNVAAAVPSRTPTPTSTPSTQPTPQAAAVARATSTTPSPRATTAAEAPAPSSSTAPAPAVARASATPTATPATAATASNTPARSTAAATPTANATASTATGTAPTATPTASPSAVAAQVARTVPSPAATAAPADASPTATASPAAVATSATPTRLPRAEANPTVATSQAASPSRQTSAALAAANTAAATTSAPQSSSPNATASANPTPATGAIARAETSSLPSTAPSSSTSQQPQTSETRSPAAQLARATSNAASARSPGLASSSQATGTPARSARSAETPSSPTQVETPSVAQSGTSGKNPTAEPARMALERSVAGTAGQGAGPNMDRTSPALAGQAPVASAAAERATAMQSGPQGPALSPSTPSPAAHGRASSPLAQSSTLASAVPLASRAGSQNPAAETTSASAALERADSNAPTGAATAAVGTLEVDTGTTQVVAEAGTGRASGGGQPLLNLEAQSTTLARRAPSSAPTASLNAVAQADTVAAPPGSSGTRAAATETVAAATAPVRTEAGGPSAASGGPTVEAPAGPQGANESAEKVDTALLARAAGGEKAPSEEDEEKMGGGDPNSASGALARTPSGGGLPAPTTAATVAAAAPAAGAPAQAAGGGAVAANTSAAQKAEAGGASGAAPSADVAAAAASAAELAGPTEIGRATAVEALAGTPAAGGGTASPQRAAAGPPLVAANTAAAPALAGEPDSSGAPAGTPLAAQGVEVVREAGGTLGSPVASAAGAAAGEVAIDVPAAGQPGPAAGTRATSQGGENEPALANAATSGTPLARSGAAALPLGSPQVALANAPASGETGTNPAEMMVAGSMEVGPMSRQTSGAIPVDISAPEGTGGLGEAYAVDTGLATRLALRESQEVHLREARFKRSEAAGGPASNTNVAITVEGFEGRGRRKGKGLDEGGGEATKTEVAIEMGLVFLSRHQSSDGSWSLHNFGAGRPGYDAEKCDLQSDAAATGLCLLTFLGAGYHHQEDRFRDNIRSGLTYLISHQKPNGDLYVPMDGISNASCALYSHGIAAMALCEAYAMTQDPELKEPAQKALDYIAATQEPKRGGWRYLPGVESDTSVSGWMVMALKSGELAGLKVAPETFEGINRWLDKAQASPSERHLYRYNPSAPDTFQQREGRNPTKSMTAVALLMRYYSGWDKNNEHMVKGADYLLSHLPSEQDRDTYYWYYATYVMCNMEGSHWDTWSRRMIPLLRDTQVKDGPLAGSWHPRLPTADRWGKQAGRLYVTTMNLLNLEVQHRRLPLYGKTVVERPLLQPK